MMYTPENLRYTRDHSWILLNGKEVTIGITDFAQKQLGEIVFVELPKIGDTFERSEPFGTVESVKAVSELFSPISGKVTAINELLDHTPELLNDDTYGDGWIIKITAADPKEAEDLLDAVAYAQYCSDEEN